MKSILTFFCSLISVNIFACSCCFFTTTFCGNVGDNTNTSVALLKVQKLTAEPPFYLQKMTAEVVNDLFDNIPLDTITVFGADGGNCNGSFNFGEGDTILMQLYEYFDYEFVDEAVMKLDTFYQNGGCGVTFLRYKNNHLLGNIMPEVNEISYNNFIENINQCQSSPSFFSISGTIYNWKEANSGVQISGMTINGFPVHQIDTNGYYSFDYTELIGHSEHKSIEPYANENMLKGVTMTDIIKIKKHILGLERFENPFQWIAADVNNSKTITMLDLIQIRKIILGRQENFDNNTSWRFTPSDYIFQTESPLEEDFDAKINHNACSEKLYQVNLIAIKIGDVDGDAFTDAN
ncbi:MAG: hypothetical protein AB8G86_23840 [Saprospiraceae bacterium]